MPLIEARKLAGTLDLDVARALANISRASVSDPDAFISDAKMVPRASIAYAGIFIGLGGIDVEAFPAIPSARILLIFALTPTLESHRACISTATLPFIFAAFASVRDRLLKTS